MLNDKRSLRKKNLLMLENKIHLQSKNKDEEEKILSFKGKEIKLTF